MGQTAGARVAELSSGKLTVQPGVRIKRRGLALIEPQRRLREIQNPCSRILARDAVDTD